MEEKFMIEAIKQAKKAASIGEMPIGAVIVQNGRIVSRGYNKREIRKNSLLHAEVEAINKACKKLGSWRLQGCDMYVTLEPCPMCAGAALNARIDNIYFGAYDEKSGCAGSVINLFDMNLCNYKANVTGGIMAKECSEHIKLFFRALRMKNRI